VINRSAEVAGGRQRVSDLMEILSMQTDEGILKRYAGVF
jgi:hypothetical protein